MASDYDPDKVYVTATEWAVSVTTGCGIEGAELNVHRCVPREATPDDRLLFRIEYAVKRLYPSRDEAYAAALAGGWIREHVRKPHPPAGVS